jgi:hypothetical protein
MNKKRGLVFVVLILVLALLVIAAEEPVVEEPTAVSTPTVSSSDDEDKDIEDMTEFERLQVDIKRYGEMESNKFDTGGGWGDWCDDAIDGEEHSNPTLKGPRKGKPGISGCYIEGYEDDTDGLDDDKCVSYITQGIMYTAIDYGSSGQYYILEDRPSFSGWAIFRTAGLRSAHDAYLCGEGNYWYVCDEDSQGGFAWVVDEAGNNILATCLTDEDSEFPIWKKLDVDVDQDGFVSSNDCDDNPTDDPAICSQVEDTADCKNDLKGIYSKCAKCINPAAPEVCGDDLNNDCRGTAESFASIEQLNGTTPDSCNNNKWSCQQTAQKNPEGTALGPVHNNIYGQPFSWVKTTNTGKEGMCCGINGLADLGKTVQNSDGDYVCLTNEPSLVGVAGGNVEEVGSAWQTDECEGSQWCWVNAIGTSSDATIFTIKQPESTYDIVSNGERWVECKADGTNDISSVNFASNPEDIKNANRFYCYEQGNTWNWADCRDPLAVAEAQNGVKERIEGDGLLALPLNLEEAKSSHFIEVEDLFTDFYQDLAVDFSDYKYIEFYLRFVGEIHKPADVTLQINGPKGDEGENIYFRQNVLGYATNNPDLINKWIHVKVPIPPMLDVQDIKFESFKEKNNVEIRNIYFSKEGESLVCSGESSEKNDNTAWLSDLDQWEDGAKITGKRLCNTLYDPDFQQGDDPELGKAWLTDGEIETEARRCCGNTAAEYYPGSENGCWNSQPIAPGETVMNIEFDVTSDYENWDIYYPEESFNVDFEKEEMVVENLGKVYYCPSREFAIEEVAKMGITLTFHNEEDDCFGQEFTSPGVFCEIAKPGINAGTVKFECNLESNSLNVKTYEDSSDVLIEDGDFYVLNLKHKFSMDVNKVSTPYSGKSLSASTSPIKIADVQVDRNNFINTFTQDTVGFIKATSTNENVDVYFVNERKPFGSANELTFNDFHPGINNLVIMAKLNDFLYKPETSSSKKSETVTKTYSCQKEECIFPLPGLPNYKITNKHPELYDMYFVSGDGDKDQILITKPKQLFKKEGNIIVRNIAQQVIYDTTDRKFWGCQAADYVETSTPAVNVPFCSVKAENFCSYGFGTVNSWSTEPYKHIDFLIPDDPKPGVQLEYKDITAAVFAGDLLSKPTEGSGESVAQPTVEESTTETAPTEESTEAPAAEEQPAEEESTLVGQAIFNDDGEEVIEEAPLKESTVLPARNIISNAEWKLDVNKLKHWILLQDGAPKKLHKDNIQGITLTLAAGEELISERIAVPVATNFYFSQNFTCQPEITLISKNSDEELAEIPEFNTMEATYIIIKFEGPCEIKEPLLQHIDALGTAAYNYYPDQELARSGVACCAQNSCWNGYACAPEMSTRAFISEHIEEGRDYRCIQGEWKYLPVKWDWNKENIGFCGEESECFVTTTAVGENPSAATFTTGQYPVCVKDGEYIFDHYCQGGNWTSRTKFVSQSLIKAAEDLDDEFIIYCSSPQDTILDMEFKNNFIIGEFPVAADLVAGSPLSGEAVATGVVPEPTFTCFNDLLDGEGSRLIPTDKNTCINNVCIFQHKRSGRFVTSFATTLNKPADQSGSFVQALGLSPETLTENCKGDGNFVKCTNLPIAGDFYYSQDLNAVIYGKDGFDLNPGFFAGVSNFFSNLFGNNIDLEDEKKFLADAESFSEIFLLNTGEKEVRAIREAPSEDKETIVAEYEGFNTPICDYVSNRIAPVEKELLELAGEGASYTCHTNNSIQKFVAAENTEFWWQELTGRLRVE